MGLFGAIAGVFLLYCLCGEILVISVLGVDVVVVAGVGVCGRYFGYLVGSLVSSFSLVVLMCGLLVAVGLLGGLAFVGVVWRAIAKFGGISGLGGRLLFLGTCCERWFGILIFIVHDWWFVLVLVCGFS